WLPKLALEEPPGRDELPASPDLLRAVAGLRGVEQIVDDRKLQQEVAEQHGKGRGAARGHAAEAAPEKEGRHEKKRERPGDEVLHPPLIEHRERKAQGPPEREREPKTARGAQ